VSEKRRSLHGLRIESSPGRSPKSVNFTLDGEVLTGVAGEPIAAALAASWVRVLGRRADGSPRGLFCAVGTCGDCAMTVDGRPGVLACTEPLMNGMRVHDGARVQPDA
jgi:hypothetical protein